MPFVVKRCLGAELLNRHTPECRIAYTCRIGSRISVTEIACKTAQASGIIVGISHIAVRWISLRVHRSGQVVRPGRLIIEASDSLNASQCFAQSVVTEIVSRGAGAVSHCHHSTACVTPIECRRTGRCLRVIKIFKLIGCAYARR